MADAAAADNFLPSDLVTFLATHTEDIVVLKFGATWCGPCKKIKPVVDMWRKFHTATTNIRFVDIDVDESMELYGALKKVKMVGGLPTMLAYYSDNRSRSHWFIPDDSVIGGDEGPVKAFFDRCAAKANHLVPHNYTYFT